MEKLHALLIYPTALGPLWAVLVSLVAVPIANEIVQRSKGTRAQSLLQGLATFILKLPAVGVLIAKIPALGDALYILAPQDKTGLPKPLLYKPAPPTAGEIVSNHSLRVLPFLLLPLLALQGCAVPQPVPTVLDGGSSQNYTAAFESCLKNQGISDATNEGVQIFQILDGSAHQSAQQIEAAIEKVLVTLSGAGAILVATCAVDAFDGANPVLANAKPTPSQAAVRLFRAKHLVAPTVHHG